MWPHVHLIMLFHATSELTSYAESDSCDIMSLACAVLPCLNFSPLNQMALLQWKAQAACAQSFALWQQTTIEIMHCNHSIITCSCHMYVVLFFTHIPFVVNHIFNAMPTERL